MIMKKTIGIVLLLSMCASTSFAQLKVTPDGKVGIGTTSTPLSNLAVGTVGNANTRYAFEGKSITMLITGLGQMTGFSSSLYLTGAVASSTTGDRGIVCAVARATPGNNGRALGVIGHVGNATSGYNYGVIGSLAGTNNGVGIFGTSVEGHDLGIYIDGKYAGYFEGNVKVTGTVNGTVVGSSDIRYKQNITELGANRGNDSELKRITDLVPVSYNYKQVYYDLRSDTTQSQVGHFDENSPTFHKRHFGLIAQELQKIYPDLVYEGDNGYLAVNYTEIIPLLIQSIKELKEEVDLLSEAVVTPRSSTSSDIIGATPRAVLYQNVPNPFTDRTEIKFELPDNLSSAFIMIFNMQGALMKQIPVQRQQQHVIINGSELTAGMYLYSLIIDGKEADTKRMILTK